MTEATEDKLAALPQIRDLTANEKQQLEYLVKEYPMLDAYMLETCLRLSDKARDEICADIKSGALKLKDTEEEEQNKEETIIKGAVEII
jgi:CHASE3 domain sensor protein